MGLPGSGKTYLAERRTPLINANWINADKVRNKYKDWDFSEEGRKRQSLRMSSLAQEASDNGEIVICDFICPTSETRKTFDADFTIWMNTITKGRFEDTNKIFEPPNSIDYEVQEWNDSNHKIIAEIILKDV